MSHKLAPLGRTHIRHGSSTPEANSKSSSPLKEWIHTHNWGDMPSVSPELKQLSGKNTVTREVVHVAEEARFDSSSSSSDGLVTKMHVARASVASVSSVSSKHTIAPKVASKHVVSKEPVNQSMEKVLAERQKVYEEAKAKKIAEAAPLKQRLSSAQKKRIKRQSKKRLQSVKPNSKPHAKKKRRKTELPKKKKPLRLSIKRI